MIVSYSYSGQTRRAALNIQKACGGEVCDIFLRQPYPRADRQALWKQIKHENGTRNLPGILPLSCDPKEFAVLFLGAPVWSGHLAPPMESFLRKYKLEGKKLIPFSSRRDDLHISENRLRWLCPKNIVMPGILISSQMIPEEEQDIRARLQEIYCCVSAKSLN